MVAKKPTAAPKKKTAAPAAKPARKAAASRTQAPAGKAPSAEGDEENKGGTLRPDEMPAEVLEFIQAIDEYKRIHRRPFPTWSEVLEVLKALGYHRAA